MLFEQTIYEVNSKMEESAFNKENNKLLITECEPLEKTVRLLGVEKSLDGITIIKFDEKGEIKFVHTNKPQGYFDSLINKKVYLSGIKIYESDKKAEKWFIRSSVDVTSREEILDDTEKLSVFEKTIFQKEIEKFSPQIKRDLCNKKILLADKKELEEDTQKIVVYSERAELDAYYNIVKKVMPKEFRDIYELIRDRAAKHCSSAEKQNYLKQMYNIMEFDWVNNADYKDIDIEALRKKIRTVHIGHEKQLNEIYMEFEACNISKAAPKTLCLIGNPDTEINNLAATIASSIGRGHSTINLAGYSLKETDALIGSSKIYENAREGLIYEHIKKAGLKGVLVIEDYELYNTEVKNVIIPLIKKTTYTDSFVEVKIDLSDMFIILTCSDIKDIPQSVRANMTTIYFNDLDESDIVENINNIIVPKYCKEYGIDFPKNIPYETCRTLIYKYANMNMNKLDSIIRSIVIKTITKGGKSFPDYSVKCIDELDYTEDDYEKIRNTYAREITKTEHKFFNCYDEYPEPIQKKAKKLFDIINCTRDKDQKEYAIDAIHYISNIFKSNNKPLVIGSVVETLSRSHYLQNDFGERIEAAILSKELGNNANRMTVIGLKGNAGTGKSSAAISVANALDRNFIKINVGGGGGAELIKGYNKNIHNAGPSLIIQELAKSGHGCYSDVLIIDELDKATPDFFNTLYEFLDPNEEFFYDKYLECYIPKNNFLVILTFNDISNIPLPIRDRMEIIEYSNYSIQDKKAIITNYILPKLKTKFNIEGIGIDSEALDLYVNMYDISPGMRNAERDFEYILMRIAKCNKGRLNSINVNIDKNIIQNTLGEVRTAGLNDIPQHSIGKRGMAHALAVIAGSIGISTAVETVINPYQDKNIVVTGLLEGSCLESVSIACCVVSKYLKKELPKLHIHMTDAVRKDGPSAGVTIVMSILSCLLEKPITNIAFTGSIDLYGNIGSVGGVFEKCIAAERSSITRVIVPSDSYRNLIFNKRIERLNIEVIPVDTIEEVILYVWGKGEL